MYRHRAILLILRGAQGFLYSAVPTTWRMSRIKEVKRLDKMWSHSKERKRSMGGETTNDQTRDDMWMSALLQRHVLQHLEPCRCMCAKDECTSVRENTRVRVFCPNSPSVTIDRYRL